jgi:ABC-type glycerol-3-phosphate transport system permease component
MAPTPSFTSKPSGLSRKRRDALWVNAALIGICLFMLLPIATVLLSSIKRDEDVTRNPPVIFPCDTPTAAFDLRACRWSSEGYARVILIQPDPTALLGIRFAGRMLTIYMPNTVLYASVASLLVVLLAAMAGYAFARYRFPGRNLLMTAVVVVTGVPLLTNMMALFQMEVTLRKTLPIFDDRVFLIVVYLGFFLPLSIWIAKGFFDAIPRELEEAAMVDGCSPAGSFVRITMPLAAPGMAAIFLLTFVGVWNEFFAGYLLITKNSLKPVMFGMYDFLGQNLINAQLVAAACVLVAVPIVIVFLLARKTFFQAMVEGAIKG